jgi:hypothetical protein
MFCQKEGWRYIVEDITFLQFSIAYESRASSMRTINSVGSADQGMIGKTEGLDGLDLQCGARIRVT